MHSSQPLDNKKESSDEQNNYGMIGTDEWRIVRKLETIITFIRVYYSKQDSGDILSFYIFQKGHCFRHSIHINVSEASDTRKYD